MLNLADAAPMVRSILELAKMRPSMDKIGVAASREAAGQRTTNPPFEEVGSVWDERLGDGDAAFGVRVYLPAAPGTAPVLPLILYAHAGGWILGDLGHSDQLCRRLCNRAAAIVVNVAYRLAPENRYPAALDDCEQALQWALSEVAGLPVDRARVALAGESSGGNLAAALALRLGRRGGETPLAYLLLLDPALDARMDTLSWRELGTRYLPPAPQMRWMWDNYLRGPDDLEDPEANPGVADSFPHHPPTAIVAAGFDPLRDEAEAYANRLAAAGVPVSFRVEEALMHAFCNLGGVIPEGLDAFDRAVDQMMGAEAMRVSA